jgi:hypothetical protein
MESHSQNRAHVTFTMPCAEITPEAAFLWSMCTSLYHSYTLHGLILFNLPKLSIQQTLRPARTGVLTDFSIKVGTLNAHPASYLQMKPRHIRCFLYPLLSRSHHSHHSHHSHGSPHSLLAMGFSDVCGRGPTGSYPRDRTSTDQTVSWAPVCASQQPQHSFAPPLRRRRCCTAQDARRVV